ncbi:MAG TPA: aldose 1-epimerase [Rhizomicrobium sp.]|nr:aldose 1-epimerase [Rhizomicrobium sp.]
MPRESLTLSDGLAEAGIVPGLGAGLAWYDVTIAGRREPVFRPCRDPSRAHPFDLALNLLVPWSNRISGGGFAFEGEFHALEPNLPGEAFPIHGNGFSSRWTVEEARAASATLALDSAGPGPFRYMSRVTYVLEGGALTMLLSVRNIGARALPFGLGFHPWLPRTPQTALQAKAARVVLEVHRHLPAGEADIRSRPEWDFETSRRLPAAFINNAFLGWDGRGVVQWPDRGLSLEISTDPALPIYIVYSPSVQADFFCFEPVTHPVDAHNLPGGPTANGLVRLEPGQAHAISCRFAPKPGP